MIRSASELAGPPRKVVIAGAAPDTGNLGVSALSAAIVSSLLDRRWRLGITLLDHGSGVRDARLGAFESTRRFELCGARFTRRWHRPESLARIRIAARLGGLLNPAARRILAANAVLDISGGDSFTDLYGAWRFRQVTLPKLIALENRIPLILFPQTYGPFRTAKAQRVAQQITRGAAMAWARDARSFNILRDLLGPDHFDPARHRLGVDVAFALPAHEAQGDRLPPPMREWLATGRDREQPLVGLNISGLIWHDPASARDRYGLHADYREAIIGLLVRLLCDSARPRILLVPHVLTPEGHYESDPHACRLAMQAALDRHPDAVDRIAIVPPDFDACEMKWIISRGDWFCGTRMHSTIAALSSGVPAAAIAYSDKTLGVFETCGQGAHVHDPRMLDTAELVEQVLSSWQARSTARSSLRSHLPSVLEQAQRQIDDVGREITNPRLRRI